MLNRDLIKYLRELGKYRNLLYMLTWRDIKVKYKQSIMGFMWAIFMPILIILASVLVRYALSTLSGRPITAKGIASVSVKAVPWAFFVSGVRFGTGSLIANRNLVTKIYFPRELFPIAATLSQFFDFGVASIAIALVLAFSHIGISLQVLWLPVLLALLFALVLSLGILLSAFALFFRDVKYVVEVILTFGIFFTPVFYEVGMFGDWGQMLLMNPLAPILEALDACIIRHQAPALGWLAYSAVFSALALLCSLVVFKRLEPAFAERI